MWSIKAKQSCTCLCFSSVLDPCHKFHNVITIDFTYIILVRSSICLSVQLILEEYPCCCGNRIQPQALNQANEEKKLRRLTENGLF